MEHEASTRRIASGLVVLILLSGFVLAAGAGTAGRPAEPVSDEVAFLRALDDRYAWDLTERLTDRGEGVAGTDASRGTARFLAEEMKRIDLRPRGEGSTYHKSS